MTSNLIVPPVDFFSRQRRDQDPNARHAGVVVQFRDYAPVFDEVTLFRRYPQLNTSRARHCPVYTTDGPDVA